MQIKDLWTVAVEKQEAERAATANMSTLLAAPGDENEVHREATILYMGPRQSGKSTLIQGFMFKERDDVQKPTTCLDYKYTRTSSKASAAAGGGLSEEKSVSHFWEMGGGKALGDLIDIPLTEQSLPDALVVLVLDLSAPRRIMEDAEFFVNLVRSRCEKIMDSWRSNRASHPNGLAMSNAIQTASKKRFGESHADLSRVNLLPIPVLVCAHKFDQIKQAEPEALRVLSRALRAVTHANGASLLYTSSKYKDTLMKTYRSRISSHLLGSETSKRSTTASFDHVGGSMMVMAGQDSFSAIGEPPGGMGSGARNIVDAWAQVLPKYFEDTGETKDALLGEDTQQQQLPPETTVDNLLAQREEDLKQLQRELDLRRKLLASDNTTSPTAMSMRR